MRGAQTIDFFFFGQGLGHRTKHQMIDFFFFGQGLSHRTKHPILKRQQSVPAKCEKQFTG
jgi:hypothetical protein